MFGVQTKGKLPHDAIQAIPMIDIYCARHLWCNQGTEKFHN